MVTYDSVQYDDKDTIRTNKQNMIIVFSLSFIWTIKAQKVLLIPHKFCQIKQVKYVKAHIC